MLPHEAVAAFARHKFGTPTLGRVQGLGTTLLTALRGTRRGPAEPSQLQMASGAPASRAPLGSSQGDQCHPHCLRKVLPLGQPSPWLLQRQQLRWQSSSASALIAQARAPARPPLQLPMQVTATRGATAMHSRRAEKATRRALGGGIRREVPRNSAFWAGTCRFAVKNHTTERGGKGTQRAFAGGIRSEKGAFASKKGHYGHSLTILDVKTHTKRGIQAGELNAFKIKRGHPLLRHGLWRSGQEATPHCF